MQLKLSQFVDFVEWRPESSLKQPSLRTGSGQATPHRERFFALPLIEYQLKFWHASKTVSSVCHASKIIGFEL